MRWQDPENGLIPPLRLHSFARRNPDDPGSGPLGAEQSDIGRTEMEILRVESPRIAVNVSAIQLQQKDFVSMVADVLRNAGEVCGRIATRDH